MNPAVVAAGGRPAERPRPVTRVWRAELPGAPWLPCPYDAGAEETPTPGASTPGLRQKPFEGENTPDPIRTRQ